MPATIVVGVDGSPSSIDPLRQAARIAEALRIGLEVVIVWDHETPTLDYVVLDHELEPEPEEEAEQLLSAAGELLFGSDWPDWFHVTPRRGRAAQVLIDKSAEAELLIGGSRGRSGEGRLRLGTSWPHRCSLREVVADCHTTAAQERQAPASKVTPHWRQLKLLSIVDIVKCMDAEVSVALLTADLFKAIAHPARVRVLELLVRTESSVGVLAETLGMEISHLSQQLGVLRRARLVVTRRVGPMVYYSILDPRMSQLLAVAKQLLVASLEDSRDLLGTMGEADRLDAGARIDIGSSR